MSILVSHFLGFLLAINFVNSMPTPPDYPDTSPNPLTRSLLQRQTPLDRRIHWEGDRLAYTRSTFAPPQPHPFRTQTSRCDRDRGATGWICDLYSTPLIANADEIGQSLPPPLAVAGNDNNRELGHCPSGSICVDVMEMIPPPHPPPDTNLGVGPFAGCLDRSHIISIINLMTYKAKARAAGVGVAQNVKQMKLDGKTMDVVFTSGNDVNLYADMEFIDVEVEALTGGPGARPDGYRRLDGKMCRWDPAKPRELVRSCRIDKFPAGADRVNVVAKTLNGGGRFGANGNMIVSQLGMSLAP